MTESVQASFYGIKSAATNDLVSLVHAGNEQARGELRDRLPQQLAGLLDMYLIAYQDRGQALISLADDLGRLKTAA